MIITKDLFPVLKSTNETLSRFLNIPKPCPKDIMPRSWTRTMNPLGHHLSACGIPRGGIKWVASLHGFGRIVAQHDEKQTLVMWGKTVP